MFMDLCYPPVDNVWTVATILQTVALSSVAKYGKLCISIQWLATIDYKVVTVHGCHSGWVAECALPQEQYIFVYDALLEALKAGKTVIGCSHFKSEFDELSAVDTVSGKSKLQQQYEVSSKQLTTDLQSSLVSF